jgi:hypothetical protein
VESAKVTLWEITLTQTAVRVHINIQNRDLRDVGIIVNGEAKGVAPGTIYLPPGNYLLILRKEGYVHKGRVIAITLGTEEIRLSEKLMTTSPFYKKWWFWGLAGGVAAGVVIYKVLDAISSGFENIGNGGS